jgi:hypothetical protein
MENIMCASIFYILRGARGRIVGKYLKRKESEKKRFFFCLIIEQKMSKFARDISKIHTEFSKTEYVL